MISGQRGTRLTCRFSLRAPPPLGLRAPPKTHHRGRGDHDASGDGIPDDDHPPSWPVGKLVVWGPAATRGGLSGCELNP